MSNPIQRTDALRLAVELGVLEEHPEITTARAQVFADFITQPAETGPSEPEGPRHRDIPRFAVIDDYANNRKVPSTIYGPDSATVNTHDGPVEVSFEKRDPEFASDAYDRGWNEALDRILDEGKNLDSDFVLKQDMVRDFIEGIRK